MRYLVKGSYPKYTITGFRDTEMIYVKHAKELAHVMDEFKHRLKPGDTIEWVENELQPPAGAGWTEQEFRGRVGTIGELNREAAPEWRPPAGAWWTEQDGAMPQ